MCYEICGQPLEHTLYAEPIQDDRLEVFKVIIKSLVGAFSLRDCKTSRNLRQPWFQALLSSVQLQCGNGGVWLSPHDIISIIAL